MKKTNLSFNIFLLILTTIFISCSDQKITQILPYNNFDNIFINDSLNTLNDEFSTFQIPSFNNCRDCYNKEFSDIKISKVKTNNDFFGELYDSNFVKRNKNELNNLSKFIQSIQYLNNNSGVISLSHNGDSLFNSMYGLPFNNSKGGTDIFSFEKNSVSNKIELNLLDEINSIYWDSHPWVFQDSNCNILLVFSSDRNEPFNKVIDLNNKVIKTGNTDLYYSFFIDGIWGDVKSLDTSGILNTPFNEISPSIVCNTAPKLFYSSNNSKKDYNVFMVDLDINFGNKSLKLINNPIVLGKNIETQKEIGRNEENKFINTNSDEKFPYVKLPLGKNKQTLLVSSNRQQKNNAINTIGDTVEINKGNFDIYAFNFDMDCKPREIKKTIVTEPKIIIPQKFEIKYKFNLIDNSNPQNKILEPIIKIKNITKNTEEIIYSDTLDINLEPNTEYEIFGGSLYEIRECSDLINNNISHYNYKKISEIKPIINYRKEFINYDSIINITKKIKIDTIVQVKTIAIDEINEYNKININIINSKSENIVNSQNAELIVEKKIQNVNYLNKKISKIINENNNINDEIKIINNKLIHNKNNSYFAKTKLNFTKNNKNVNKQKQNRSEQLFDAVEVKYLEVSQNIWYEGKDTITKQKIITYNDTIPQFDTSVVKILSANAKTNLTKFANIKTNNNNECAFIDQNKFINIIYDTLILDPQTYNLPSCEYVTNFDKLQDFNQSVPYFQTAFWEVNTSQNLKRHKKELQKDEKLGRANCIDLNYANTRFGYGRKGVIVDKKIVNRDSIQKNYEDYSTIVDKNLQLMADTILYDYIANLDKFKKANKKIKLIINLEAFSDIRDADACDYYGQTVFINNLKYELDKINDKPSRIELETINLPDGINLGKKNENLSNLRAYFGLKELLNVLMKNKSFKEMYKTNKIYDPTTTIDDSKLFELLENSDIIFNTYGKGIETNKENSNILKYDLDRRLNLKIELIEYYNGYISKNKCCF